MPVAENCIQTFGTFMLYIHTMRHLINFLIKYNHFFAFILWETVALVLLFRFNQYHQVVFLTSANEVTGKVYEVSGGIRSYFNLKMTNTELLDRNMRLEQKIADLEKVLQEGGMSSVAIDSVKELPLKEYQIFNANVINNSLTMADNYITLDKGTSSGIRSEMGVVGINGIVGIVYITSPNYSVVISVLNSKSNISCKIKNSDYFGYLKWEIGDSQHAYLRDLPRHAEVHQGDTVITSGYSTVFPAGMMVGTVDGILDTNESLSDWIKVKLATDFGKISEVRVIARNDHEEIQELENRNLK
ncbi:MAG: Cell shape-determining protein MreC [Candidatus Ordinivivax streblomastigis]|uniref:Cell shape-determining protein MreC n=1 Tax=Candidatus Ordinivivax streblomastigis TaxID=2540710 RepID=A0A5M8NYG2_9BACT|nr:MAG: Cell shape-determining protein MreC [Candidatus Ordinivivax streblomastigis]